MMVEPPTNHSETPNSLSGNYAGQALARLMQLCPGLPPELARYYTLLVLVRGGDTSFADVHDAWALWRNDTRPQHPSLVPFHRLDHAEQAKDAPFVRVIRRVAADLAATPADVAAGRPDDGPDDAPDGGSVEGAGR